MFLFFPYSLNFFCTQLSAVPTSVRLPFSLCIFQVQPDHFYSPKTLSLTIFSVLTVRLLVLEKLCFSLQSPLIFLIFQQKLSIIIPWDEQTCYTLNVLPNSQWKKLILVRKSRRTSKRSSSTNRTFWIEHLEYHKSLVCDKLRHHHA